MGSSPALSESILVADDSMTILAMVSSRLERAGYDVVTVTRGDDALRVAGEIRPRLAVFDVEMPGLDGIEVTRQVRLQDELAGTLIILLTSRSEPEMVERGLAAGANDYIIKPFSPQELQTRIEELLARR